MADRTIKPDDTNDLVLQNNDGSAKIEVNEAQTVVLTGGSTTALTIDTSGNTTLGGNLVIPDGGNIGSASDTDAITIASTGKINTTSANAGTAFEIENTNGTTNYGLFVKGGTSSSGTHYSFGINNSADTATFRVFGDGNVKLNTGNLIIGTAGKGIDFSQSQTPASGMTAEILDSYEIGTWNPEYHSSGGTITATEDIQSGYYTKIGRQVHVFGRIRTDSLSGGSGSVYIQGLPFTAGSFERPSGAISTCSDFANDHPSSLYVPSGQSYFILLYRNSSDGGTVALQVSDLGTGANSNFLAFSVTYFV